jgi:hypothetical protein
MSKQDAVHLGDGAYATFNGSYEIILTANHHDYQQATDRVHLDNRALEALVVHARSRGYKFGIDPEN